jgi:hypothetical protein
MDIKRSLMTKEVKEEVKTPVSNKLDSWLILGYEKLAREYGLSIEDIKSSTITIKGGEVTVKGKK